MAELVRTYIERNISGTWSDISSYVVGDLSYEYLIPSNSEDEKLAAVGEMELVMNNGNGAFSPNPNFQRGTPIRVTTVYEGASKIRFLGNILEIDPDTLEWGDQYVHVTVVDWMNFAIDHPMIVPQLQANMKVGDAVAYVLAQMAKQPESVIYYEGRETFDFTFDTIKKETRAYSELNKMALSEFAPIYLRAGNVLVVESADTRNGTRELTTVPKAPNQLHAILADPNGYAILKIEGTNFAILADERLTPNLATGTVQQTDIEIINGDLLTNRIAIKAYPSRTDAAAVKLYQMDVGAINIWTFSTRTIKGTWANPNGGEPINAVTSSFAPMITGTNYVAFNELGQDISTQLVITERYGTEGFEHTIYNNGIAGFITKFDIYGKGIYPYNPTEHLASVTGSVASYGVAYMTIDQKYQDTTDAAVPLAEMILDRNKDPRLDVKSVTFEASSSPELMQASQYMDTGDLTWVKNVKPAVDTYAYIQGKKTTISPAGWVTEQWYLKEMDSLRNGLNMVALRTPFLSATKVGVSFGTTPRLSDLSQKTITAWLRTLSNGPSTAPILSKYDGTNGWYFFVLGPAGQLHYRENFNSTDGQWKTSEGLLTGSFSGVWSHLAVTYDNSSVSNSPTFYFNGAAQTTTVTGSNTSIPVGIVDTDAQGLLILNNLSYPAFDYFYSPAWEIKDVRMYERILQPYEIAELASNPNNYTNVQSGLVFQAPTVRREDYGNLTGTVIYPNNKILDNIYGYIGTPNWNFPSGTSFGIRVVSPLS